MKYITILLLIIGFSFPNFAQQTIDGSIMHDGIQRDYILYIPAIYDGNTDVPFGGYKKSGNGREKGVHGLQDYLEVKAIMGV